MIFDQKILEVAIAKYRIHCSRRRLGSVTRELIIFI